jgi:hypothetical protein
MASGSLATAHSTKAAVFLTTLLFFILTFMNVGRYADSGNFRMAAASGVYVVFLSALAFLIYKTGRISRYRSIFFSVYAIGFIMIFIPGLLEVFLGYLGSMPAARTIAQLAALIVGAIYLFMGLAAVFRKGV